MRWPHEAICVDMRADLHGVDLHGVDLHGVDHGSELCITTLHTGMEVN